MKLKKWISKWLRRKGYQLVPMPYRQLHNYLSAEEEREVDGILQKFAASQTDQDLSSVKALKGYLSTERMNLFCELVDVTLENDVMYDGRRLADVGCGMAYLFRRIGQIGHPEEMIGLDTYEDILPLAMLMAPEAAFQAKGIFEMDDSYDVVFCMEVLEHMVDPHKAVAQLLESTNAGGHLVLSVPNGRLDFQAAGQIREDGGSYWGHIHFWSPESWRIFLEGFSDQIKTLKTGTIGQKHLYAILSL
jgi:2-polyprenyl-3-methyl-5-hydroxy-6-metoxy-1,4-benzoquinol methylase